MPKITNKIYKQFLNPGEFIDTLTPEDFTKKLNKITYKNKHKELQAKGLLLLLYWSEARPAEILLMKPQDFTKEGQYFKLKLKTLKGGEARIMLIPKKYNRIINKELNEFYEYCKRGIPGNPIFYKFAKKSFNKVSWKISKKFFKQTPLGFEEIKEMQKKSKLYERISANAYYLCIKWMGFPPYFFRHNRFTRVSEKGGSLEVIKELKGAKDLRSGAVYVKYSKKKQLQNAKFIN